MNEIETYEFMRTVRARYTQQLCAARQRNIPWLYTFETWWQQWQESGKWEQRGNKLGQWCMGRRGDIGPYSPDNVDIIPAQQNSSDGNLGKTTGRKGKTMEELYGVERAKELKENLRKINTGIKQSTATCKKKSDTNKGKPWTPARRMAEAKRKAVTTNTLASD